MQINPLEEHQIQLYYEAVGLLHIKKVDPSFDITPFEDLSFLENPWLARSYWAAFDILFPEEEEDTSIDI